MKGDLFARFLYIYVRSFLLYAHSVFIIPFVPQKFAHFLSYPFIFLAIFSLYISLFLSRTQPPPLLLKIEAALH